MKKPIEITKETAVKLLEILQDNEKDDIYKSFPELKPKKRWFEEYEGGSHLIVKDIIKNFTAEYINRSFCDKSLSFKNQEQAEQQAKRLNLFTEMQVFANFRNGDWVADWNDEEQNKYGIVIYEGLLSVEDINSYCTFIFQISVKSEEIAQEMLEEFGDRIKECFGLK